MRSPTAVGSIDAVATSSCTAALHLALIVAGIGPGDDVIVPSLSFVATANVVGFVGATVVFADVDESTLNLTPETISASLTPRTRAVIVAHQAGAPADMTAIHERCDPAGIIVIEDAACAIGSTLWGRPVGSHSDLVAFSFHPRKVITTGEGGMLATSRPDWAEPAAAPPIARHEHERRRSGTRAVTPVLEEYLEQGLNYRMTDLQASVGLVQLDRLEAIVERRRRLAARYQEGWRPSAVWSRDRPSARTNNYQSFWARCLMHSRRATTSSSPSSIEAGIGARRGIMASHLEPAYSGHRHGPLPVTERVTAPVGDPAALPRPHRRGAGPRGGRLQACGGRGLDRPSSEPRRPCRALREGIAVKVLVFAHRLELGGSQINAIELAAEVRDRYGHDVVLFATPGPARELALRRELRVLDAPVGSDRPSARRMLALRRAVRDEHAELVHAWDLPQGIEAFFGVHLGSGLPLACSMMSMTVPSKLPRSVPATFGSPALVRRGGAWSLGLGRAPRTAGRPSPEPSRRPRLPTRCGSSGTRQRAARWRCRRRRRVAPRRVDEARGHRGRHRGRHRDLTRDPRPPRGRR